MNDLQDLRELSNLPIPKAYGRRAYNFVRNFFPSFGNTHKVHVIYIVPSDKMEIGTAAITKAMTDLQEWYRVQMGNNKTFTLTNPVVQVCYSAHPAAWFSTHDTGGDHSQWYWINCLDQLSELAGGGFFQPFNDWICYVDAEPATGQGAGGTSGGTYSGVCVLTERDLRSLLGNDPEWTVCREIGGLGHEGGHSLGLPHPPPGSPDWGLAIMGYGYSTYPRAILTIPDKAWLNSSPFFTVQPRRLLSNLCPFDNGQRRQPTPRPRPTPERR